MSSAILLPRSVQIFWRDLQKPGDIYGSLRILFLITFLGGVLPLEYRSKPKNHLKPTIPSYCYAICIFVFFVFIFLYVKTTGESVMEHFHESNVSRFTDNMRKFNGMIGLLIALGLGLWRGRVFVKLLQQLEDLELRLSHLGLAFHQRNNAFWINLVIVSLSCANLAFILYGSIVFTMNGIFVSPWAWISFYSPHLIVSCIVMLFNAIMQKVTMYFKSFNKVIVKIFWKMVFI